uniref:Uncharacterized protein n=1 Tax=Leptobrachium leishanense TaxID=445787 RepID=A0A8C5PS14_9ANUR
MNKATNPTTQRILDLTLEIIYLLTGEDHMVVKVHDMDNSSHKMLGYSRTQKPSVERPPPSLIHERHNEQKILELSNQIIRLLTGEVPIRCEDVTVYLSMEEWEYVERHKDLYEDVMMEDHQPVITLDNSASGEFHSPASLPDFGTKSEIENITDNGERCRTGQAESVRHTKRESLASEERHVPEKEIYPITEHAQTRCPPTDIKEEPALCDKGNLTDSDIYERTQTPYTSTHTKAESDPCGEGDVTDPDRFPPRDHTLTDNPFTDIKEESQISEGGNLTDSDMYKPPEHTHTIYISNVEECVKGKINATEPRNPNKSECPKADVSPVTINADPLTQNPNNRGNSVTEPEKDSYCESTDTSETNCREENVSSDCRKNSTCRSGSLNHQKVHTEEEPFSSVCEKRFKNDIALQTHQRIHRRIKPFKCAECEKCFPLNCELVRHQRIHKGEKPYNCTECGKCFTQGSYLASHLMIHTGEKPYKCPECGKCFSQKSVLAAHKFIHTGEKPFSCPECGKCFTQASALTRHKKIHKGEKPFQCPVCGKCFTRTAHVTRHKSIHTGEKPFQCPECGECFTLSANLAKHRKIHTRE